MTRYSGAIRLATPGCGSSVIRYSPKQSAVEVSRARNNGKVVVDVRDHGPGVPEEALPRLFDPFYRVENDRDRASGGIGLGLSIARRAIELHKGAMRARNAHPGLEVEMDLPPRSRREAANAPVSALRRSSPVQCSRL